MTDSISRLINASSSINEGHAGYHWERNPRGRSAKFTEGAESKGSLGRVSTKRPDFAAPFQKETAHPPATNSMESFARGRATIRSSTVAESKLGMTYTSEPKAQEERGDS